MEGVGGRQYTWKTWAKVKTDFLFLQRIIPCCSLSPQFPEAQVRQIPN